MKRFKRRALALFNPDTYTRQKKKEMQRKAQMYNAYIILGLVFSMTPLALYLSLVLPRIQRVKREFYMHQYEKAE